MAASAIDNIVAHGARQVAAMPLADRASMDQLAAGLVKTAEAAGVDLRDPITARAVLFGMYLPALAAQSGWHPGIASLALSQIASGS